jgi:hypothetical protein
LTYLYAGLGIAMLTGIMAMFEMGLSLTGQQSLLSPPSDAYTGGTPEQRDDRLWMQLLHDSDVLDAIGRNLNSQLLCDQLVCRVDQTQDQRCDGSNAFQEGYGSLADFSDTLITDPGHPFPGACVLSKGDHRVLIVPREGEFSAPYGVYSCLTSSRNSAGFCSFEG